MMLSLSFSRINFFSSQTVVLSDGFIHLPVVTGDHSYLPILHRLSHWLLDAHWQAHQSLASSILSLTNGSTGSLTRTGSQSCGGDLGSAAPPRFATGRARIRLSSWSFPPPETEELNINVEYSAHEYCVVKDLIWRRTFPCVTLFGTEQTAVVFCMKRQLSSNWQLPLFVCFWDETWMQERGARLFHNPNATY